jgi:hypothetical protein
LPVRAADSEGVTDMAKKTVWLPVQMAGIGAGMAVGIPFAMVRQVITRTAQKTGDIADKMGGKEHFPPNLFAAPIGLGFGLVVGTAEGMYWGGRNAFKYGFEKPFTPASFSMNDDLES